jgi:hypothetical protein
MRRADIEDAGGFCTVFIHHPIKETSMLLDSLLGALINSEH